VSRFVVTVVVVLGLAAGCKKDKASAPAADKAPQTGTGGGGIGGKDGIEAPSKGSGRGDDGDGALPGNVRGRGALDFLDGELEIAAGAIDKDVVKKVVKENTTKLQYCYEKTLLANPGIEGKVIATFTIAAEGSVSDVKCSGVHPEVESCVAETVRAFKFPPSGKKVDVHYPFSFKPA
jgi:hypothetical protein